MIAVRIRDHTPLGPLLRTSLYSQSEGQTSRKLTTAGIQPMVQVLIMRKVMRAALQWGQI